MPTDTPTPESIYAGISSPEANRFEILGEQLHRMLDNGDPSVDSSYEAEECVLAIRQANDKRSKEIKVINADKKRVAFVEDLRLNKEAYFEDMKGYYEKGGSSEPFLVSFPNTKVELDRERGQSYITLPEQVLAIGRYQNLPSEQLAIIQCMSYTERMKRRYIPATGATGRLIIGLYESGLQGNVAYQRESERVYFLLEPGAKFPDSTLLLQYIIRQRDQVTPPDPGYLEPADDLTLLALAYQIILHKGTQDKINDSSAKVA